MKHNELSFFENMMHRPMTLYMIAIDLCIIFLGIKNETWWIIIFKKIEYKGQWHSQDQPLFLWLLFIQVGTYMVIIILFYI